MILINLSILITKKKIIILIMININSLFKKICNEIKVDKPYKFLNEKDSRIILQRARIFEFRTEDMGITDPNFFMHYIYYWGIIDSYPINRSKLINITFYQVTQEHEILGHLNVNIQNYFSDKEISSPIVNSKDANGKEVTYPESGETVQKLLYGRFISSLTINEILFILDLENYKVDYEIFRNNFIKCNSSVYKISDYLSKLLSLLDITLFFIIQSLYFIFSIYISSIIEILMNEKINLIIKNLNTFINSSK